MNKQMGKRDFVASRARPASFPVDSRVVAIGTSAGLKRIAKKVNPLTECVTDDECRVEIEKSVEFFEEAAGDAAKPEPIVKKIVGA